MVMWYLGSCCSVLSFLFGEAALPRDGIVYGTYFASFDFFWDGFFLIWGFYSVDCLSAFFSDGFSFSWFSLGFL